MAWNEPGGNQRDPWNQPGRDNGPPDLDEVIRRATARLSKLFGSKGGDGSNGKGGGSEHSLVGIFAVVGVVVLIWLLSGIYIVDEGKRGVETRFGAYKATTNPGLNYRLPYPIEAVRVVDVEQRRATEIGYRSAGGRQASIRSVPQEALMLTQDENIVDIRLSVQYQISDPRFYLFNVRDPDETLRQVVESAARKTVGKSSMDFVLTEGRSDIVANIQTLSQEILESYEAGLIITNVNLQDAQPPEEVQDAFADAIKAREDEQRLKNEAEAYANEVIPRARGEAARRLEEAEAYRAQITAEAEGEAERFTKLLTEYVKAPEVTRERLYIETMEKVLGNNRRILIDTRSGNNLFYLPLDQMGTGGRSTDEATRAGAAAVGNGLMNRNAPPTASTDPMRDNMRLRDTSRLREVR